jgi:FkbM family methyltransferase
MGLIMNDEAYGSDVVENVRAAYRFILGREADDGGLDTYCHLISAGKIDYSGLRTIMFESEEFAQNAVHYRIVDMPHGLKVVINPDDPDFGKAIAAHGTWESHIVDAIRGSLRAADTFVDIGANVGVMSFNAANVVGSAGKVIGFEPNPRNVSAYRRGLTANGFENVTLFPFALSDHRHMITVSSASNGKVAGDASPTQAMDVIQAITGDEILLNEPRVDFLKIDIEGWELPALKGVRATLARHKPLVLCEFNPLCLREQGGIDGSELADFIFSMTNSVQLVEHDHSRTTVSSTAELMSLWATRDAYHTSRNELPAGWVHFDLLFEAAEAA